MTEEFRKAFAEALCSRTVVSPEDMMVYLEARGDGIGMDEFLELCRQFGMDAGEIVHEVQMKLEPVERTWEPGGYKVGPRQYIANRNIAAIIKAKRLNQRDVAHRAGFSEAVFSNIVNQRRKVYADEVYSIASALGVSVEALFAEEVGA